jgi:hypothetical protein
MEYSEFTFLKWREMNFAIVKELHLPKKETLELMQKLVNYKYVDEISDLKYGTYLRWINIEHPSGPFVLAKGAVFCEIKITNDGVYCVCKNVGPIPKYFQIRLDTHLFFQKFTKEEIVLMIALEHAYS